MWFRRKPKPDPAEAVTALRRQALTMSADELGLTPTAAHPRVWGILMETGYPEAVATLVAIADGTASLYFSNGGGIIGAGAHAAVQATLPAFFAEAEAHVDSLASTTDVPLPGVGCTRFYLRTFAGTLTDEAPEADLGTMKHPLSRLFHTGHAVLSAMRVEAGG